MPIMKHAPSIRRHPSFKQRFREKVQVNLDTGCWEWSGSIARNGYGLAADNRRTRVAHRISYELFVGAIPEGMELDHLCRVRHCVSPDHLEPVTHVENVHRGSAASRTHCKQGHEYTAENTRVESTGKRKCRACHRARCRASYARLTGEV